MEYITARPGLFPGQQSVDCLPIPDTNPLTPNSSSKQHAMMAIALAQNLHSRNYYTSARRRQETLSPITQRPSFNSHDAYCKTKTHPILEVVCSEATARNGSEG
ncbi:hypothetical protein ACRALDRAFT_205723 [Sodiomyces alcalophilus JCM 7366]|uniref:uncharacterized protein n=1 Tax=Sodiomyces alcalophilus JCM 7366 TaxID=591952 RepID=UPI0039B4D6EC